MDKATHIDKAKHIDKAIHLFEYFLHNISFMTRIDDYIECEMKKTKIMETKSVPGLVLLIMNIINEATQYCPIKNNIELQQLLGLFYNYVKDIIAKSDYSKEDFKQSFDICVKLAAMNIKFSNNYSLLCRTN
jgi:hypothetical protein